MTERLRIVLPGMTPVGKGRGRASGRVLPGGRVAVKVRTPTKTAEAMDRVYLAAQRACSEQAWTLVVRPVPVSIHVAASFAMPHSWSVRKRTAMSGTLHTQRPDGDNIAKLVMDALNGLVWQDDTQVADLRVVKRWEAFACLSIEVEA